MVEALLTVEDAYPVMLGPQTPISEIVRAAQAKQVDVVCLSFSTSYPTNQTIQGLTDLRQALSANVAIWAGGFGVKALRKPIEGVLMIPEFADLFAALAGWRHQNQANSA
jgi:hypothetical protein